MRIWLLWLRHRRRGLGALLIVALALAFLGLFGVGDRALGVRGLGNAAASRTAAQGPSGTVLPRSADGAARPSTLSVSSVLDTRVPADADPQMVAAAQAAWSADEIAKRQDALLVTINCARQAQRLKAVAIDPKLSETAGTAWLRLVHDSSFSLMQLPGQYALRSVLPLSTRAADRSAAPGQPVTSETDPPTCGLDGLDLALPTARAARRIGIAVFPPQASWDLPSAVVLMQ